MNKQDPRSTHPDQLPHKGARTSFERAIHLGGGRWINSKPSQAMTREGDNETSAKAACRNAGYASFELEGMLDTTYMILGIKMDALLRGTWNLPGPGVERNTAEELQRFGGLWRCNNCAKRYFRFAHHYTANIF